MNPAETHGLMRLVSGKIGSLHWAAPMKLSLMKATEDVHHQTAERGPAQDEALKQRAEA